MILLGITITIVIIGILCIVKAQYENFWDSETWAIAGAIVLMFSVSFLIVELTFLFLKPLSYKNFKIKYDTIKETITSKDDIRDATFTNQIIEINKEIKTCNEFKNSAWFGIFQNEQICKSELLTKE